ncbi:TnsD family Tn7-like transposition protein [Janthinobacterium sp.]|uniref:TnsD family Tn7-like transposition protein n=1 Tax=Janthinobacterium sp. TaxID=1871054 RepID=UPI00397794E4
MVPSFPHGETINSFLIRHATFNGGLSLLQQCVRLGRANPSLDCLPSFAREFCEAFNFRFGNEDVVLHSHTLFDFYCCGLPPGGPGAFDNKYKSSRCGPVRPVRLPVLFSSAERGCLSCSACDAENELRLGFSFDHRSHTIPFIHVCPFHETELVRAHGKGVLTFDAQCRNTNAGNTSLLVEYAKRANDAVAAGGAKGSDQYAKSSVIAQFTRSGCIAENGRWAVSEILHSFHTLFDDAFADARLRCMCHSDRYVTSAIRALQREDRALHPVWCILFRWLSEVVEFKKPRTARCRRVEKANPDEQTIRSAVAELGTLTAAARALNLDVSALSHLARGLNIQFQTRTKTVTNDVLDRVNKGLEAGDSVGKIAADCEVSLATVYRIRRASSRYMNVKKQSCLEQKIALCRVRWSDIARRASPYIVTELRKHNNALWSYLYRHDREWLSQFKSEKQVKNVRVPFRPPDILHIALKALDDIVRDCCQEYGRPEHLSRYRIEQRTGLNEYAVRDVLSRRPPDELELNFSREAFLIARIKWITALGAEQGAWLPRWRCARVAGLRVASYNRALRLLPNNICLERF